MSYFQISWVCCSLQQAHSTPTLNSSNLHLTHSEERYPHLVPYRKYMHVINSRYTYFFKNDISQDLQGSEQGWFFLTKQWLSQWKLWWVRIRVSFLLFLKNQFFWGWKKTLVLSEWIHPSVCVCVCFFSMDNATCPLHWCIGWVRHLWPSGDWEPVFACR